MPTGTYKRKRRGKYKKGENKLKIQCKFCGANYLALTKRKQFCSKICISRYNNNTKCEIKSGFVIRKKNGKNIECSNCKKIIYRMPCHLIFERSFCGRECFLKFQNKNAFRFPCKICGIDIFTQPAQLKLRSRTTCSKNCRSILARQRAEVRRKEQGYTKHQLDRLARYSPESKLWREAVFKRDNYTCQNCGIRGNYLEADHIKPFAYFPELRFELSNGRTLCKNCHNKTKISYKEMRKMYEK
jgi:hypothetical protein